MAKEGKSTDVEAGGDAAPPPSTVGASAVPEGGRDASTREIVHTAKRTGAKVRGPIPLPTRVAPAIADGERENYYDRRSKRSRATIASTEQRELSEEDLDRAEQAFRQIKPQLEAAHLDRYVAIDIDDGCYVVADSRLAAQAGHREKYGENRYSCTFHIGTAR